MTISVGIPVGYPWVLAAASGSVFLHFWHFVLVVSARKKASIKYPQMYATKEEESSSKDAKVFNCVQRAHQNTIENLNAFVLTTLIAGLGFPRLTVGLAGGWVVSRILYTLGYSTGEPARREAGAIASILAMLGLLGTSAATLYQLLSDSNFQL